VQIEDKEKGLVNKYIHNWVFCKCYDIIIFRSKCSFEPNIQTALPLHFQIQLTC